VKNLLTEVGSVVGLASGIFLVWDRFMAGQPLVWPARRPKHAAPIRYLRCVNVSKWDILIKKITVIPNVLSVASDDSAEAILDADHGISFRALIAAGATRDFPLGIRGGDDSPGARCVIIVSWRSARSTGLFKVPVIVFSSVQTIRAMDRLPLR
jgi:hypothetical protein